VLLELSLPLTLAWTSQLPLQLEVVPLPACQYVHSSIVTFPVCLCCGLVYQVELTPWSPSVSRFPRSLCAVSLLAVDLTLANPGLRFAFLCLFLSSWRRAHQARSRVRQHDRRPQYVHVSENRWRADHFGCRRVAQWHFALVLAPAVSCLGAAGRVSPKPPTSGRGSPSSSALGIGARAPPSAILLALVSIVSSG
jgi:hypothetical protein